MGSRRNSTQKITGSEGRDLPTTAATKRKQDRATAKAYRARKALRDYNFHPMPQLVAVEVDGKPGYWRAIHHNGMVQTVLGTRTEAYRKVRAIVDKLNAFEEWCRQETRGTQRMELL